MQRFALLIQHRPWEGGGLITESLEAAKVPVQVRVIYRQAQPVPLLPNPAELGALVIMGGPMSANETDLYPGLGAEIQYARACVDAGVPTLGICLGHQILARALGAAVVPAPATRIGLAPVTVSRGIEDNPLKGLGRNPVLHWHSENVELPVGAQLLARSETCPVEAFRYGSALGLQFHVEVGTRLFAEWMDMAPMRLDMARAGVQAMAESGPEVVAKAEKAYRVICARWAQGVAAR
jgi:GMP synthase-like glutamine amidotransferase